MLNCADASNRYASFARLRDRHAPRSRLVGTHQKRRPESVVERFRREHDSSCSLRRHQLLRVRLLQATIQKVSRAFPQRRRIDAIAVLKSFTDVVFRRARGSRRADWRLPDRARTASNASSRHENARPWCKKCHAVQKRRSRHGAHRASRRYSRALRWFDSKLYENFPLRGGFVLRVRTFERTVGFAVKGRQPVNFHF